jgi:hypothetical protein
MCLSVSAFVKFMSMSMCLSICSIIVSSMSMLVHGCVYVQPIFVRPVSLVLHCCFYVCYLY